jgi:hypothetical protein
MILGPIRNIDNYRDLFDTDVIDVLVRDNLQETYWLRREDGFDPDAFDEALLEVIRYYSTEPEFEQFLKEIDNDN